MRASAPSPRTRATSPRDAQHRPHALVQVCSRLGSRPRSKHTASFAIRPLSLLGGVRMSRARDTLTRRATPITSRAAVWNRGVEGQHCEADHTLGKRVKYLLNVLVLL